MNKQTNWRRGFGQRMRCVTREQAIDILARIRKDGQTIFHPEIRILTGGLNSQSINAYVIRKLGIKAGVIKNKA